MDVAYSVTEGCSVCKLRDFLKCIHFFGLTWELFTVFLRSNLLTNILRIYNKVTI